MADNFLGINKGIKLRNQGTTPSNLDNGDVWYDSTNGFQFRESGTTKSLSGGGVGIGNEIVLTGYNGYGSTNTMILRFSTVVTNTGSTMSLTQSSTNGDSVTINTSGLYSITITGRDNSNYSGVGISLNSAALTTNIQSQSDNVWLAQTDNAVGGTTASCTRIVNLSASDVIRPHSDGSSFASLPILKFSIIKIG